MLLAGLVILLLAAVVVLYLPLLQVAAAAVAAQTPQLMVEEEVEVAETVMAFSELPVVSLTTPVLLLVTQPTILEML